MHNINKWFIKITRELTRMTEDRAEWKNLDDTCMMVPPINQEPRS